MTPTALDVVRTQGRQAQAIGAQPATTLQFLAHLVHPVIVPAMDLPAVPDTDLNTVGRVLVIDPHRRIVWIEVFVLRSVVPAVVPHRWKVWIEEFHLQAHVPVVDPHRWKVWIEELHLQVHVLAPPVL